MPDPRPNQPSAANGAPRVLALTSLYPDKRAPSANPFNRQQFQALAGICPMELVAPVAFTRLLRPAPGPQPEEPFRVSRPVYWYPPGLLRAWHGRYYLASAWAALRRAAARLRPDALLATWAYPDGWAALAAARRLGLPLVLKLHGSDIHQQGRDPARRPLIAQALAGARAVVAVSDSLAGQARLLGAPAASLHVVPNGVDLAIFHPAGQAAARAELGLPPDGPLVLFVGRLAPVKDPLLALEALAGLPDGRLVVVGDGPLRQAMAGRAQELGLGQRVIWAGGQPHGRVARYMAAADCLCLCSLDEGSPNVVREALDCGLPVASSAVGDAPQMLAGPALGKIFAPGDGAALAEAVKGLCALGGPRVAAPGIISWQRSAELLCEVLALAARAQKSEA